MVEIESGRPEIMNRKNQNSYQSLDWSIKESIGYLTLKQPPANTMTLLFFVELHDLTEKIKRMEGLKGIIISGEGRHFSSGANLKELTQTINEELNPDNKTKVGHTPEFMKQNLESFKCFEDINIPVVAAIKGVCIGSAFELALFCHFRLCATNAIVGLPESTFGLMPGLGGIQKVRELTGKVKAMELVFRGNTLIAQEALKFGVIDRIYSKDQLLPAANELISIASAKYRCYNKKDYFHLLDKNLILNG
jgi:enoyl-CoA hydratase/carnithine racemase